MPERPGATMGAGGRLPAGGEVAAGVRAGDVGRRCTRGAGGPLWIGAPRAPARRSAGAPDTSDDLVVLPGERALGACAGLAEPASGAGEASARPGAACAGLAEPASGAGEASAPPGAACRGGASTFPTLGSGTPGSRPSPRAPTSSATAHRTVSATIARAPRRNARALRPLVEAKTGDFDRPAVAGGRWVRGVRPTAGSRVGDATSPLQRSSRQKVRQRLQGSARSLVASGGDGPRSRPATGTPPA